METKEIKNIKIKPLKKTLLNEIQEARICLIDNDKGVVVFYD